jgi:hypothetical protein
MQEFLQLQQREGELREYPPETKTPPNSFESRGGSRTALLQVLFKFGLVTV